MRSTFAVIGSALLAFWSPGNCMAQLARGGTPLSWAMGIEFQELDPFVPEQVPGEEQRAAVLAAGRFGLQLTLVVDVPEEGAHTILPDGTTLVRALLRSPGAAGLMLQFDRWELDPQATVFVYDVDRRKVIGALGPEHRSPVGDMATALLPGDAVVVELQLPPGAVLGELRVASITHAVVDPLRRAQALDEEERDFDPGYQSAPCHVNVNCPQAAAWQQEKRAVAMFLRPDGNGCTGTLINNTAQPGRPLFYAANHCFQPNTSQWVFYFNYEAPGCVGSVGNTDQTLVGATFRAAEFFSDFTIVELFTAPPASFQPYYAGWDRTGIAPQNATVIHHPLYDVKKYTHDNAPATDYFDPFGIPLWRNFWDVGIVEAVSSGAALWDQNKRIVGHMTEGAQDCTNAATVSTGCAKFSAGWEGQNPDNRKRDWLDPANTTLVLNGFDPFAQPTVQVRPRVFLEGPYTVATDRMSDALRSHGLVPAQEPYSAMGYALQGGGGETVTPAVLATTGDNAVVDWVVVELRSTSQPQQVLAARAALLQRDGDVVAPDGLSPVSFNVVAGSYHVGLRHRNHLGVITAAGVNLSATPLNVDLSNSSVPLWGAAQATKAVGSRRVLYAGDVNGNGRIAYVGAGNDRDPILEVIGGVNPTAIVTGYRGEDVNMDGVVRYTGTSNDRDIILVNIGGIVPTEVRLAQLP